MKVAIVIPFLVVIVDLTRGQLNLPEMPGPPYPDKFGNNRWGVKYDPRVHGRGRSQQSSPSAPGIWGGDSPQYSAGGRSPPPPRNKWTTALRPLVSRSPLSKLKSKRKRRPSGPKSSPFDPTSDSFYKDPFTSKAIDGYVKNYLSTYNKESQSRALPIFASDLVSIQDFSRPSAMSGRFRSRSFAWNGNRRSSAGGSTGSLTDIYGIAAGLSDDDIKPTYQTVNPQDDFFGPKINKKNSDFAKTLSSFYNDYKPGAENADSGISSNSGNSASSSGGSSSNTVSTAATDANSETVARDDDYPPSYYTIPPPPSSSSRRPRPGPPPPSSSGGPTYVERPYLGSGSGKRPRGRPFSSRGPPPPPRGYSSGPLSSLDLYDDMPNYSSRGPPIGLYDDYSDSPMIISSGDDGSYSSSYGLGSFSSSGPVRVTSYRMPGPPSSSSLYSSPIDSFGPGRFSSPFSMSGPPPPPPHNSNPFTPPLGVAPAPPPLSFAPAPVAPVSYLPTAGLYYPPALVPLNSLTNSKPKPEDDKPKKKPKSKRKKKRLQHTPMNVLRGLLGRGDRRDRERRREHEEDVRDRERDSYQPQTAYAINYPVVLPAPAAPAPPPQYSYNPAVNTLAGPRQFDYPPPAAPAYASAPPQSPHPPPAPAYSAPSYAAAPPPQQPASPLLSGIATLRDTLSGLRPYRYPPPPPPPHVTYITYNDRPRDRERERRRERESKNKEGPSASPSPGPITQHLQDWPRIFTAMGSSVDAVAGGIHAVRKEISKMTGQTMAKGVLMSGAAVHEVTKGVAHVITKMATI